MVCKAYLKPPFLIQVQNGRFWPKKKKWDPPWNQAPQRLGVCQGQKSFTSAHWSPFWNQRLQSVWPPLQLWYKISRILNTGEAVSCVRCKVQISRNPAFGSKSSHAQSNHGMGYMALWKACSSPIPEHHLMHQRVGLWNFFQLIFLLEFWGKWVADKRIKVVSVLHRKN